MAEEFRLRLAQDRRDFDACVLLQRAVWGLDDLEITSAIQMIATTHAGGMVHLVESAESRVIGFAYAFPALRGKEPHLHSDMLAVLPEYQKLGLGVRLKWAQRSESLARGLDVMTWTYDPLQARNANLNLRRLGAEAREFLENFYGLTTSTLHHGLPTDRLLVRWELRSTRVETLAKDREPAATVAAPSLPRINDVKWQAGWPVSSEPRLDLDVPECLFEIPPDWNVLCQAAPRVAEGWHLVARRAFQAYFARGYRAADFAPTEDSGRRRPFYVLRKS